METPSRRSIFLTALRLGCVSFGGPVAHLGFFRREYVGRKGWISDAEYADLVALCQFLPGPASSQTGFAIGLHCRGLTGGVLAFLGFTLPSVLIMLGLGVGIAAVAGQGTQGWIVGLKLAALAVVADAVRSMAIHLCPDRARALIAVGAACVLLSAAGGIPGQVLVICLGGAAGWWIHRANAGTPASPSPPQPAGRLPLLCLALFGAGLIALPPLASALGNVALEQFASAYRSGALVFGGGHVVLPLLEADWVGERHWVSRDVFLAGYGAAQALPGPLFSFAAFLGAAAEAPGGLCGGLVSAAGIFLPGLLLVLAVLPVWVRVREQPAARAVLQGVNAAVVGILLAALIDPLWPAAILVEGVADTRRVIVAILCFAALAVARVPSWAVVLSAAALGAAAF